MILALALLTVLVYSRVWSAPFVYDDANWVQQAIPSTWAYWHRTPWRAAQWLGGGLPWAFHGLVLGLHLVNGLLVWSLARRWLTYAACVLVLTLFWLHPIQVEAVAYVSGGIEVLLTAYALMALVCGLSTSRWLWLVGGISLFLAASMKLSAVPVLLIVPVTVALLRGSLWRMVPAAVVAAIWVGWPAMIYWGLRPASWARRLQDASVLALSLWRYLGLLVWPVGFSIEHTADTRYAVVAGASALLAGMLAWMCRRHWAAPLIAWSWIVALLLPRALVPHDGSPLTEHHTYLPFLAVWYLAGSAFDRFTSQGVCSG